VDGKLDKKAWAAAPAIEFVFTLESQSGAKQKTTARLLWDDDYLYVGYECEDVDPRMVKKFIQHICNTSIARRGARGNVLGFWAFCWPFRTGRGGRYLSPALAECDGCRGIADLQEIFGRSGQGAAPGAVYPGLE